MNGLEFGRGHLWPLALALPLLLAALYAVLASRRAAVLRYGAPSTDRVPTPLGRAVRLWLIAGLGLLCWCDPRYGDEEIPLERRGLDVIFCLDTSRSMLAADLEPDRLSRARADIAAVLPELQGGDRAGLVVFAGQARTWIPLTHDTASFRGLLDEVDTTVVPVGGTDLAAALRRAAELAQPDEAQTTVVVLLTDGEDLEGAGRQAAHELREGGLRVYAVGYGSMLGSKITLDQDGTERFLRDRSGDEVVSRLDVDGLSALAEATGGEFVRADAMALPVRQLYKKRIAPLQKRTFEQATEIAKKPRYQWVLLPLLALLLYELATTGGRERR
ncbi:MAG: VWA domain-containing protein [Planctomycetota bacterium]